MKIRALTCCAAIASILAAEACAQSAIQAAARNKILDSTSSRHDSASATAGNGNRALYSKRVTFVDPFRPAEMDWGAGLGVNSVGTYAEVNPARRCAYRTPQGKSGCAR